MGMGPAASIQTALRTIRAGAAARAEHRAAGGGPGEVNVLNVTGGISRAARDRENTLRATNSVASPAKPMSIRTPEITRMRRWLGSTLWRTLDMTDETPFGRNAVDSSDASPPRPITSIPYQ